jgi:hypothetical protein
MAEGLSPSEVGKEIADHRTHSSAHQSEDRRDRLVSIVEAVLLAVVAVLAAWSGYSAAKWGTESRVELAKASTARTEASRANLEAMESRNFDASTFNTWFIAFIAEDTADMAVAERRFRPEFRVAFDAWVATNPRTNPDAPPGPTYMPEYVQPEVEEADELDASAEEHFAEGEEDGQTADDYVRTTVYLATVLFLVGISGHFRVRVARYGLVAVGSLMLIVASIQLIVLPKPPT